MKYKLNLNERLVLIGILPPESNIVTLKAIRKLKEDVGITDEDSKKYEIKVDSQTGAVNWNKKGNKEIEFEIGELAEIEIKKALEELNNKKKLKEFHISIYEKFVESKK